MSWDQRFPTLIGVPNGLPLATLRDAATYITALPKSQQDLPAWQTAIEALMFAAEDRGPLIHAQVGVMRAMHPQEPSSDSSRKDAHWGRRKLAGDR